jgi:hypothetical protein
VIEFPSLEETARLEAYLDHIQQIVEKAPPLTEEQKDKLRLLMGVHSRTEGVQ